jgi:hypothetical protein
MFRSLVAFPSLSLKHWTRVDLTDNYKHSSLSWYRYNSYCKKNVYCMAMVTKSFKTFFFVTDGCGKWLS